MGPRTRTDPEPPRDGTPEVSPGALSGTDQTLAATNSGGRGGGDPGDRLSPGALVGRYVVIDTLGAGGMGVVYAAYDPELDRKVAVKLLHASRGGQSRVTEGHGRLLREAQAMAKLSHPGVVTVHDVGEHEGRVYVAMEFVEGRTLGAWLKESTRRWPEVLAAFQAAGLGLAAAHERGLVHRDFKPDNLMVGADGRVRVMDFGLARPTDGRDPTTPASDLDGSTSTSALGSELTREGSVVGTPAYMAPEQHLGREVGPAADQFSFCVAMYESLYGERPFGGHTLAALALSVTRGELRSVPAGKRIPGWLRRVCLRGLAVEPQKRFSSMSELLGALSRGQARVRIRRASAAVVVLASLGLGAVGHRRYDLARQVAACEADGATIAESWNDDARAELRDSLMDTGVSNAATTVERLLPYFDAQADAWKHARTGACLDARVHEVWDAELFDRSVWCLDERRMELEALADELARADATTVQRAVVAAAGLSRIEPCRDASGLRQMPRPPGAQDDVQAVRRTLSQAGALSAAGRYEEGLEVASQARAQAEALGWPPLSAAAKARSGALLEKLGRYREAEVALEDAYFEAVEHGAPEVAAEAATALVFNVGAKQARTAEGIRWARHADSVLAALGEGPDGPRRAAALNNLANLQRVAGAYAEARALHERSLAIKETVLGPGHPDVATSLNNLAVVLYTTGDYAESRALHQRALAIREKTLGADHPEVASSVHNLALVQRATGAYAEARALHERALAIREKALGPEHPDVATTLNNLANVHEAMGAYAEAKALHERALAIAERALGPDHPDVAQSLNNLALVHQASGDYERARALSERAVAIKEKALGPEHPEVASSLNNLAAAHRSLGAYDEAKALYERAFAIREKALGPEHPRLAFSLTGLAEVALAQGRPADAIMLAQRAVKVREAGDAPTEELAESRFVLARAMWEAPAGKGRDRTRARALAVTARDAYRELGSQHEDLARVDGWLEAHPGP